MTIAEAKQLRIVDYLASLGYHPQSVTSKQYWYLSPLRDERTPSFKVNDRLNEWYDFGAATGRRPCGTGQIPVPDEQREPKCLPVSGGMKMLPRYRECGFRGQHPVPSKPT